MSECVVGGRFEDFGRFERALKVFKEAGVRNYSAYGPVSLVELDHLLPWRPSLVNWFAYAGAIAGLVTFYLMCRLSSLLFDLITGGKPAISNVPFVVVTYEGTILLGAIGAFIGVIFLARLARPRMEKPAGSRYTGDSFGIEGPCTFVERGWVVSVLTQCQADEIYGE